MTCVVGHCHSEAGGRGAAGQQSLVPGEGGQEEKRWEVGSHLLHRSVDVRVVKLEYMLFSETNEEETYRG